MNYSAFSLSFCIFTFLFLGCSGTYCREGPGVQGGRGGPHAPVIVLPGETGLGSRPHVLCHHPHCCSGCNPECQLSSVPAWQAHAPSAPRLGLRRPGPCRPPRSAGPDSWTGGMSPRRFLLGQRERATLGVDAAFRNAR